MRDSYKIDDLVRAAVVRAMHAAKGNKEEARKLLGISRTSLYRKLGVYSITAKEYMGVEGLHGYVDILADRLRIYDD